MAPADASHGFDPDGQLGQIASMKWKSGSPSWSLLSASNDLGLEHSYTIVRKAIEKWSKATLGVLHPVEREVGRDQADIIFRFQTEQDNPTFHKHPQIIGYAYFPGARKTEHMPNYITFNDSYHFVAANDLEVGKVPPKDQLHPDEYLGAKAMTLLNVAMHELGHAIGLPHAKDDPKAVMAPYYNGVTELAASDVERARALYPMPDGGS